MSAAVPALGAEYRPPFRLGLSIAVACFVAFQGVQYLAILTIAHGEEQVKRADNRAPARHAVGFYARCLGPGYLFFQFRPPAFVLAGFSYAENLLWWSP